MDTRDLMGALGAAAADIHAWRGARHRPGKSMASTARSRGLPSRMASADCSACESYSQAGLHPSEAVRSVVSQPRQLSVVYW
jgi:hypothetical protein